MADDTGTVSNETGTPCSVDSVPSARTPKNPIEELPDDIIEQILYNCDPNSFASAVLLNSRWRSLAQRADLYAWQLLKCPSYAASHNANTPTTSSPPALAEDLPKLRKMFAREVKRNLFEAYLRPKETVIKLISNSISSSSAPGGEGMQFSASPMGHHLLAYNSSRIHVIDLRDDKIHIRRELMILRRPVAACVKDDGTLLAVLSSEMQVDFYDMKETPPKRSQSLILDNPPRSIAISPCGSVLAAAYEGGIEVSSLKPGALATDRRSVKCDAVDSLAFSFDSTQILGTTTHSVPPTTVILTAPYLDPNNPNPTSDISGMWTNSLLFPNTSKDCSHALMLEGEGGHGEAEWIFTYDRNYQTFRAVRIDDLRNGSTYFTGPLPPKEAQNSLTPCAMPAATRNGDVVSALFQGKDVWIYGIPGDLAAVPASEDSSALSSSPRRGHSSSGSVTRRPSTRGAEDGASNPTWQLLSDQGKHTFVKGFKMTELSGASSVKWVSGFGQCSSNERLVIGARGTSGPRLVTEEEDLDFVDGGRITLLDFDYGLADGVRTEVTIEVGTDQAEALEEEKRDLETDVAIVRRRTVAQKRGGRSTAILRAATSATRPAVPAVPIPRREVGEDPLVPRRVGQNPSQRETAAAAEDPTEDEDVLAIEQMEALDAPYSHASPRPGGTLRRAATAAAVNRTLNPRTADGRPIQYRRADGRREHPHESDADNWKPPPPPYQKEDPGDIPAFLRGPPVFPRIDMSPLPPIHPWGGEKNRPPPSNPLPEAHRSSSIRRRPSHHRTASDSTTMSRPRLEDIPRPLSTPSVHQEAIDLYDVTPPDSPRERQPHFDDQVPSPVADNYPHPARGAATTYPDELLITNAPSTTEEPTTNERNHFNESNLRKVPEESDWRPPLSTEMIPPTKHRQDEGYGNQSPVVPLPTAQTWPLRVSDNSSESLSRPPTAGLSLSLSSPPSIPAPVDDSRYSLPPLPSSDQLASLNKRVSGSNPRRLSGSLLGQRPPSLGSRNEFNRYSHYQSRSRSSSTPGEQPAAPEPDQPLIISTPRGIVDTLDKVQERSDSPEPVIFAPVPRINTSSRPVVDRLETIWSATSDQEHHLVPEPRHAQHRFRPPWMSTPNLGVVKPVGGDATPRNKMLSGQSRSWNIGRRGKKNHHDASYIGESYGATQSGAKARKDKRCVVM